MRSATAYLRKGGIFIYPLSKTVSGIWILSQPVSLLDASVPAGFDGAIRSALAASRHGVPTPSEWGGLFAPVLELANVKSWSTFVKGAKCVEISESAAGVAFLPTRNLGAKGGFEHMTEKNQVSSKSDADLGILLQAAFDLCE